MSSECSPSSETQGFKGEGDGKETGSEKSEEKEGEGQGPFPAPPPPFLVFLAPISFPPPSPLKPWVSEDECSLVVSCGGRLHLHLYRYKAFCHRLPRERQRVTSSLRQTNRQESNKQTVMAEDLKLSSSA